MVQAFNDSLRFLTEEQWNEGMSALAVSRPNLSAALDGAELEIMLAVDDRLIGARRATAQALKTVAWGPDDPHLKFAAFLAVGALLAMDLVPKEELTVAFQPFRRTSVEVGGARRVLPARIP